MIMVMIMIFIDGHDNNSGYYDVVVMMMIIIMIFIDSNHSDVNDNDYLYNVMISHLFPRVP